MLLPTLKDNALKEMVAELNHSLPDILSKATFFKQETQHSISFQSLTMLNGQHPMRVIRQIVSEITHRRNAVLESSLEIRKLENKLIKCENDEIKTMVLNNRLNELKNAIANTIKEILVLNERYGQIEEKHNIKDWTETDFEEAESSFHVRRGFELLYQNLVQFGRPDKSTIEYLQQYGIHPQVAVKEVEGYIISVESAISKDNIPDSSHLEDFLDGMMRKYIEAPRNVSSRLFGTTETMVNKAIV